jgi:cytochrome b561
MIERRAVGVAEYGGIAKTLHWVIVVLLIVQYALAWIMPDIRPGTMPETLINAHFAFGMLVLVVAMVRLLWRAFNPVPPASDDLPWWQHRAAKATHTLLYVLLFALPVLGWASAAARGWGIDFAVINLSPVLPLNRRLGAQIGDIHTFFSYALLAVVGLHVLAALYHHFWMRDSVLVRILPERIAQAVVAVRDRW